MVNALPAPARRYFLHAIKPGTPIASAVHLRMTGTIRLRPGQDQRMTADQIIAAGKGFVWKANAGKGVMFFSGADHHADGKGRMRFRPWGLVPLIRGEGPDVSRSAIGRLVLESLWLPTALLPEKGAKWSASDDSSAAAALEIDGERAEVRMEVDDAGRLRSVSGQRWGDRTEDGSFQLVPFGGKMLAERAFDGHTIPAKTGAGWWFGTATSSSSGRRSLTRSSDDRAFPDENTHHPIARRSPPRAANTATGVDTHGPATALSPDEGEWLVCTGRDTGTAP